MKQSLSIYFTLVLIIGACTPDDLTPIPKPPIPLTPKQTCIIDTISDDSTSGFIIMDPGTQEYGKAVGTKINEEFDAGLQIISPRDSVFGIKLNMIWPNRPDSLEGEDFILNNIPLSSSNLCVPITSNWRSEDSVRVFHQNYYLDVGYLTYDTDPEYDNYLYIDTFNVETGFFRGYFSARMIGDTFYLPELPRVVEYINVEMTAP